MIAIGGSGVIGSRRFEDAGVYNYKLLDFIFIFFSVMRSFIIRVGFLPKITIKILSEK